MNYRTNQPAIFSAQTYGTKTTVEIDHCDLDLDEVMNAFQTLIVGMGYSNDALKHWVLEKAEEYREDEPEFDGAGFSYNDRLDSTLKNVLGDATNFLVDEIRSHYVSNEEADEDAFISDIAASMAQDEQRYEDSLSVDVPKAERGLITQRLLDYVDEKGAVSYGELHDYYKRITGSNSFSHILKSLRTPYKNRPTQRYLSKEGKQYSDAKYIVKLANPSNWVIVDEYDDYKTFNEAPYGDN
jgi:hypothetical protein